MHRVRPGTKARVQVRPPSREWLVRIVLPSSWIQAATTRPGSRGSTAICGSTAELCVNIGLPAAPQGGTNGDRPEIRVVPI